MDLPVTSWLRAELDRLWKELETNEIELSVKELQLANEVLKKYPNAFTKKLPSPGQS